MIYVFNTIFLILILSNMLIAFMGTVYTQAEENRDIEDTREMLIWIQEVQIQALWDQEPTLMYMHSIKDDFAKERKVKSDKKQMRELKDKMSAI